MRSSQLEHLIVVALTMAMASVLPGSACSRGEPTPQSKSGEEGTRSAKSQEGKQASVAAKPLSKDIEDLDHFNRPLTQSEVNIYLEVMRATAERCKSLSAEDKAAIAQHQEQMRNMAARQKSGRIPTEAEIRAFSEASDRWIRLTSVDELVAEQKHVDKHLYGVIKSVVESAAFPQEGSSGEGEEGYKPTPEEMAKIRVQERVLKINKEVVAPYRLEIVKLHTIVENHKHQVMTVGSPAH
jgi:TolA-binding protein